MEIRRASRFVFQPAKVAGLSRPADSLSRNRWQDGCVRKIEAGNIGPISPSRQALTARAFRFSGTVQMMCAAGDTTLYLARHVRDRGDVSLEQAVHELTGKQADVFGFHDRGRIAPGLAADLTVFSLDDLHWDPDVFVDDLPGGARRLRRPPGGYRYTIASGGITQIEGELTGATPAGVLDSAVG